MLSHHLEGHNTDQFTLFKGSIHTGVLIVMAIIKKVHQSGRAMEEPKYS